jgi:hypothetical protein
VAAAGCSGLAVPLAYDNVYTRAKMNGVVGVIFEEADSVASLRRHDPVLSSRRRNRLLSSLFRGWTAGPFRSITYDSVGLAVTPSDESGICL